MLNCRGVDFSAVMIHAAIGSNLLDQQSWAITPAVPFDTRWLPRAWGKLPSPGYLEGNAVLGPDGQTVYNILRVNSKPVIGNQALKLRLNQLTNTLVFDRLIQLPGGHSKFVIRQDQLTRLYFTLSNVNENLRYTDQRNILVLCVSVDLNHWGVLKTLLVDDTGLTGRDSARYTGFHYVDWQFDGDHNIVCAIRTSYRGANSYHNSNRLTFLVVQDFRSGLDAHAGLVNLTVGPAGAVLRQRHNGFEFFETATQEYHLTPITVLCKLFLDTDSFPHLTFESRSLRCLATFI